MKYLLETTVIARALFAATYLAGSSLLAQQPAPKRSAPDDVYYEFQVEKPVTARPGNPAPRYPDVLRSSKVEGQVLVQFVVDTMGHADTATVTILRTTHDLFAMAVKQNLPSMEFTPAEVGRRKVKQLVQMPFVFSVTPPPPPAKPPTQ
jgi:TonB family protein